MKFPLSISLLAVAFLSITGCESFVFDKTGRHVEEEVTRQDFYSEEPAAVFVKGPELYQEVKVDDMPAWINLPVKPMQTNGALPFHFLNAKVLGDNGLNFIFSDDIEDPNLPISVNIRGRIRDALDDMSHVTGYSYKVNGNTVHWSAYVTETFNVTYIPGDYSYLIGSTDDDNNNSNQSGESETVEFGGNVKEYSSVKANGKDAFTEISQVTKQIVGKYGTVASSAATSSVIVTTTKARMEQVRQYFETVEKKLGRQIAFDIKLLRFTSNIGGLAGVNWEAVKQSGSVAIDFNGGGISSLISGTPVTIGATKNGGRYDGSQALVSLLETQGKVSIVNSPKILTQPNRVAELELSDLMGYVSRTEVTPSTSMTSSEPTVSIRQGIVESGYKLYALANIGHNDKIILHLSTTYIPTPVIERKEILTSAVESPKLNKSRNVSTVVMRNGETMMISGLLVESATEEAESALSSRFLPTRKSKSSFTTETIALVTPVIIDQN